MLPDQYLYPMGGCLIRFSIQMYFKLGYSRPLLFFILSRQLTVAIMVRLLVRFPLVPVEKMKINQTSPVNVQTFETTNDLIRILVVWKRQRATTTAHVYLFQVSSPEIKSFLLNSLGSSSAA